MAMSFVKCFSMKSSNREGYSNAIFEPETMTDSEDETERPDPNRLACDRDVAFNTFESAGFDGCVYKPETDGPFSKITPSMWPIEMIAAFSQPEDSHPPFRIDAYGFVVDEVLINGDNGGTAGGMISKFTTDPMTEVHLRTKWLAFLELTYNMEAKPRMKWSDVERQLRHCRPLEELIQMGLPNSMRAQLWLRFSRGLTLSAQNKYLYSEMVEKSKIELSCDIQAARVLPNNSCFMNSQSVGSARLSRILRCMKWMQRRGKYIESQESVNVSLIAAHLLLICEEEEVFWLMLAVTHDLKSLDHQSILKTCIAKACPEVDQLLKSNDIDISLISWHWFASMFASFLPEVSLLFHLWDFYFYYGSEVLFQLVIGIIDAKQSDLTNVGKDSAALFNQLEDLLSEVSDMKKLMELWQRGRDLLPFVPEVNRRRSDASISSSDAVTGASKSEKDMHDLRKKNIVQTSILVELHEAIVAIGQHFETYDPRFRANFSLDLSEGSAPSSTANHSCNKKQRLAKALVDFQRNDPDELGFKKHDIIRVMSERDEDCWIGELNGITGWFPAQFVLPLDHSDDYAVAGDDRMVMFINDLVRGRLCQVLKQILSHGLKKGNFLIVHPWTVIQDIASACVQSDFSSVYAKLLLTKAYRLDDASHRVLTPCEILYKNITHISQTHADQPMDIRLRSLICLALNQRMLHDFFTVICATQSDLLETHYHEWGYIRSPVWRLIRAELRLLTQFSFNLNPDAELPLTPASPISKDGVRDMLVKHHLFSWDV
jgi:hypothetical protein